MQRDDGKNSLNFEIKHRWDPNISGGGTLSVTCPPTAHMVHSISSLAVAVDTLGGYNWRHHGDFSISTYNPKKANFVSKFEKKKILFFRLRVWFGGV